MSMTVNEGQRPAQRLEPIFDASPPDPWDGATWIGSVDTTALGDGPIELRNGAAFHRARLLIWSGEALSGTIEVPITNGSVSRSDVDTAIAELPGAAATSPVPTALPPASVVLCTRDRPVHLGNALRSLLQLDYPEFDVLVVDNNPASGLTPPVVNGFDGVRLVDAHMPGLSIARNVGLRNAHHDIVVFTDDDVVLDPRWLRNLVRGFTLSADTACVCGMVPTAELITPSQGYFDRRVAWARHYEPRVFSLARPPADDPLFPLRVAQFGTGANFAVKREVIVALGGFDEGLGVGSPAGGGEDIDMFVRVLLAGHALVRQPSAVAWHRHRTKALDLEKQIYDYGLGLGAWIFKLLLNPVTLKIVTRRAVTGAGHLRRVTVVDEHPTSGGGDLAFDRLSRLELRGVRAGPAALIKSRFAGRRARPLTTARLVEAVDQPSSNSATG